MKTAAAAAVVVAAAAQVGGWVTGWVVGCGDQKWVLRMGEENMVIKRQEIQKCAQQKICKYRDRR